jgi:hypothetical protein
MKWKTAVWVAIAGLFSASMGVAIYHGLSNDRGIFTRDDPLPDIAHDFSTPEGAILCLEDAYRAKDIEAAVRCRDFPTEARLRLEASPLPQAIINDNVLAATAKRFEEQFREYLKVNGFPDMTGVESRFRDRQEGKQNMVIVTEEHRFPDGSRSTQRLLLAKGPDGWRVVTPLD